MRDKDTLKILIKIYIIYLSIVTICFVLCNKAEAQVFAKPTIQASLYEQSIGIMVGYQYENRFETAINYQIGNKYNEKSLFLKYNFTNNNVFNIGISMKVGYVNDYLRIYFPALEQSYHFNQHSSIELGLRPSNYGLLFVEPRYKYTF